MEIEDSYDMKYNEESDTHQRNSRLNMVKRKFCMAQKELLHFVNNYEYFVCVTVIEEYTKKFNNEFHEAQSIIEISKKLKEYLYKITDICQISSSKTQTLFEVVKSCLEICAEFNMLVIRLEQINIKDPHFLREIVKIEEELSTVMTSQHQTNRLLFQILYQYNQKGYKLQIKTLFSNLNFNLFYMNEAGEYTQ